MSEELSDAKRAAIFERELLATRAELRKVESMYLFVAEALEDQRRVNIQLYADTTAERDRLQNIIHSQENQIGFLRLQNSMLQS